jgi:hypothetical protein
MNKGLQKLLYAIIAIPLFIFWPMFILVCTICRVPEYYYFNLPTFFITSMIYYLVVIIPLNKLFSKYINKNM